MLGVQTQRDQVKYDRATGLKFSEVAKSGVGREGKSTNKGGKY